jgi:hypothetical protein
MSVTRQDPGVSPLELAVHRRILAFLNEANHAGDLVDERPLPPNPEGGDHEGGVHEGGVHEGGVHEGGVHEGGVHEGGVHEGGVHDDGPDHGGPDDGLHRAAVERRRILDPAVAEEVIELRDREFPLGFRNVKELLGVRGFEQEHLDVLRYAFGNRFYGRWSVFPQAIPRRGPGGYDGVVHAALLHTGQVLFITADETTLLWNPGDPTVATFEDPVNQPHLTPDAASGYSVLCGGHSFLSDGRLLVVGGGGYGPHAKAVWGYTFDPGSKTWARTAGSMVHHRWYPTVLTLGDQRVGGSREVLVVCGHGAGDMEIYDEASDSFREVTAGDDKRFPSLYPGLHLLPDNRIFYTRTGWASAGPGGGPFPGDDQSAVFALTGALTGAWTDIAPVTPSMPDRTKGMSVMLLSDTPPRVRIMVLGGSDASNNNSYELIDATSLNPASNWGTAAPFPDGERRSLASAVLLPDGTVFVCGGIQRQNSPCALFDPRTGVWSAMAALPSVRDYHSVAVLLPSGQVAMAGWNNTSIEIFDPPYLFRGPRPVITGAPPSVSRAQAFEVESPDAATIAAVVLARPSAVTHQTDTEQKILNLPFTRTGFSTFGTVATSGAVTDRFGVGNDVEALTFAAPDLGYGPNLFYFLRRDASGFSTFGTIATSGAVTDRFGVGNQFDALTFAPGNHGYGPNLFYYLRRDLTRLTVTAPGGSPPHSLAQQGHYMMFALNSQGVPSIARWIHLT